MKILNKEVLPIAKICIVVNNIESRDMSKYSNPLIKAGVKLTEILFVGLFDSAMKSISVGELRKGVSELEELLKCTGVNVVVDATGAFERDKYYPHYIFRKTFERDVSKWKSLGVLEDKLTEEGEIRKFVCGVRVDTIVREKESKALTNSEFKLNIKDFNIIFIKDIDSAKKAFKDIAESQRIYGDLETNTLRFEHKNARILTVAWTPQHKPLTSYVFAYDHPKVSVTKEYQEFIQKNVYALMTKRNTVFHNGLFDLKFISRFFKVNPFDTNMDDTFVIARILKNNTLSSDERRESVSLKTLAFPLVGDWEVPLQRKQAEIIKEKGISKDDFDYSMYEVEDLVLYAGIDTIVLPFVDEDLKELNSKHPAGDVITNCWEATWKDVTRGIVALMLDGMPLNVQACKDMIASHEKILDKYSKTLRQNDYIKQVEGILTIEAVEKAMEKYNEKVAKAEALGKVFKGLAPDPLTKDKYDSIVLKPEFSSTSSNHKHILLYDICKCENRIVLQKKDGNKYKKIKTFKTIEEACQGLNVEEALLRKTLRGFNKREIKGQYVSYEDCTDTFLPKADDDQFIKYNKMYPENEILKIFSDIATKNKELGTYLKPWLEYSENSYDGRIHSTYSPDTTSFRWASTSPNLQHIPKSSCIRDVLGVSPDSDTIMMSQDFSQLEVIININLSKDKFSIDMFNGGIEDEHSVNSIIAGKVSPKFSALKDLEPLNLKHLEIVKEEHSGLRKLAKGTITFPMTYLASPLAVKMGLDCSDEEALSIYNSWWDARQGYRDWVNQKFIEFRTLGYGIALGGLPILAEYNYSLDSINTLVELFIEQDNARKNKNTDRVEYLKKVIKSFRTFVNYQGQSGALLTNLGMNRLYKWARENGYYLKLANTVHDDLIVEVKKKDLDIIWSKQKEFMTLPYSDDQELPVKTEAEVGHTLQYEVGKYENEERLEIMQKLNIN